jgi:hypothetical protein
MYVDFSFDLSLCKFAKFLFYHWKLDSVTCTYETLFFGSYNAPVCIYVHYPLTSVRFDRRPIPGHDSWCVPPCYVLSMFIQAADLNRRNIKWSYQ